MKIIDSIKTGRLKKKKSAPVKRLVRLKLPQQFESVLIIIENADEQFLESVTALFPNGEIRSLSLRSKKEDESPQFRYTVNAADFSLTGVLKNDKLKKLFNIQFDLIVDLSQDSALLNYFIPGLKSSLVVGKIGGPNESIYDLLLEPGTNEGVFLHNIKTQLNLLGNGHHKI